MIRSASMSDIDKIMDIINDAKNFLASNGSSQWNGPKEYPNILTIKNDIFYQKAFVYLKNNDICGYVALAGVEKNYDSPTATWLTNGDNYITVHRLAVADKCRGMGISKELMSFAYEYGKKNRYQSVRIDTHPKNIIMQNLMNKLDYVYCGSVIYSTIEVEPLRLVYEKIIK